MTAAEQMTDTAWWLVAVIVAVCAAAGIAWLIGAVREGARALDERVDEAIARHPAGKRQGRGQ